MLPARLIIFFKEHQIVTSKRSELYGQTDILANCGGLLGLFMGVSVLSIIEFIYYFTLRLGCTLRNRRPEDNDALTSSENKISIVIPVDEKKNENKST